MKIGIVACDILKKEIEFLTANDPDFTERIYLEFALHEDPPAMRDKIVETVDGLVGKVDAIFLGYAICSSLDGITKRLSVPSVMLPGADCIDALLGTDEYNAQKKICSGTWFSSPGWAEEGTKGLIKELHLDSVEGVDPSFFFDILFASYERTLFIDTGIGDSEYYEQKSLEMANELKLRQDCTKCELSRIEKCIADVKALAKSINPN